MRKTKTRNIITVVVVVALLFGAIGLFTGLFGGKTTTIGPGAFSVGALNTTTGKYEDNKKAIYTEDMFACDGLRIKPAFEAEFSKYQVFYYTVGGQFLECKEIPGTAKGETFESDFAEAAYARIVIFPKKPTDVKEADWKISTLKVRSYAKDFDITVSKNAVNYSLVSVNYYNNANPESGKFTVDNVEEVVADTTKNVSDLIEVKEDYAAYVVYVRYDNTESGDVSITFADGNNEALSFTEDGELKLADEFTEVISASKMDTNVWKSIIVEVPEEAEYLRVMAASGAEIYIYGVAE